MNKLHYLIVVIFLFFNSGCKSQDTLKCEVLTALLDVEKLNTHLKLGSNAGHIRVLDQSEMFRNCECSYKNFSIGIIENIPLDFNTGRYIDLAILKASDAANIFNLEIFYALSGQQDDYPNLFTGDIRLTKTKAGVIVEKANIGNIQ
ncbi:MAG: hypothetical protein HRU40_21145 [Saprospiraceae bacterium]|nr:hypothetical protein [Saprospiraceae bacterium]